ncbi:hypothetical protein Scep_002250 [Stephania cephalantha]|uniref:Uncharacterized protein n=1 Tax=Stephania cephalantha TaxID=152367 RepID=A0AAP0LDH1_9MAGN
MQERALQQIAVQERQEKGREWLDNPLFGNKKGEKGKSMLVNVVEDGDLDYDELEVEGEDQDEDWEYDEVEGSEQGADEDRENVEEVSQDEEEHEGVKGSNEIFDKMIRGPRRNQLWKLMVVCKMRGLGMMIRKRM